MNEQHQTKWQRSVSPISVIAAGFTTLCCLGIAAALSFGRAGIVFYGIRESHAIFRGHQ